MSVFIPTYRFLWVIFFVSLTILCTYPRNSFSQQLSVGVSRVLLPRAAIGEEIGAWGNAKASKAYEWDFDDPSVTAITIEDGKAKFSIVGVDTLFIYDDKQTKYIENRLKEIGLDFPIILNASHAHALSVSSKNIDIINNAIFEAITKSVSDLEPAQIGFGTGYYYASFNRVVRLGEGNSTTKWTICKEGVVGENDEDLINGWRRSHPLDSVDDEVGVITFKSLKGNILATIFNYASHPVIFGGPQNYYDTPDYPAQARRIIENKLGGFALFLQGFAGDINPQCSILTSTDAHVEMVKFGTGLGSVALSIASNIGNYSDRIAINIKSENLNYNDQCAGIGRTPILSTHFINFGSKAAMVGVSGEPFTEIGIEIKRRLKSMGFGTIITAGYINSAVGYIPDNKSYDTGGYGTKNEYKNHRIMCVENGTSGNIIDIISKMAK